MTSTAQSPTPAPRSKGTRSKISAERKTIMRQFADLIEANADELP